MRRRFTWPVSGRFQLVLLCLWLVGPAAWAGLCDASAKAPRPTLELETAHGRIALELFEQAAPRTLPELVRLVEGRDAESPYYDGLAFDYTKPHVEIATSERAGESLRFRMEIDAGALGLDERRIAHPGEAMDVLQQRLLKAYRDGRRSGALTPELLEWVERWYDGRRADFLVGASEQQVNEALGYVYEEGLASRPVTRGAVVLKTESPGWASPRLGIVLADVPSRTGRWMVIGRVIEGLEVADRISDQPLLPPHRSHRKYAPVEPVVIESLRFVCRQAFNDGFEEEEP